MVNDLVNFFISSNDKLIALKYGREVVVFIISMLPILELRGGLIAATLLGLKGLPSFIICFIGNMIPVPFILWLVTPLFNALKKTKLFSGMVNRIENRAISKKEQIEKYKYIGLMLFVGIPLPGTGAWTGCLIASLLNMDKKKSVLYTFFGVLMAGIIMMILSFGLLDKIIH